MPHPDSHSSTGTVYEQGRMAFLSGHPCNSLSSHTARIGWLDEQDDLSQFAQEEERVNRRA